MPDLSMYRSNRREVLDCASPLALSVSPDASKAAAACRTPRRDRSQPRFSVPPRVTMKWRLPVNRKDGVPAVHSFGGWKAAVPGSWPVRGSVGNSRLPISDRFELTGKFIGLFGKARMVFLLLFGLCATGCSKPATPAPAASPNAAATQKPNATAPKLEPPAPTNEIPTHKAFFERRPNGRDPFFPASVRLPRVASDSQLTNQPPRLPLSSYIKLMGIRPSKTRPLAMINDTLFEPGERGDVSVLIPASSGSNDVQKVRIRCLEIRGETVVIQIEGESGVKELRQPVAP